MDKLIKVNDFLIEIVSLNQLLPKEYAWVLLLFLVVFCTLLANLLLKLVLKRFLKRLEKTNNLWDEKFFDTIRKPARYFIGYAGLLWALQIVSQYAGKNWSDALNKTWDIGIIAIIGWFILRLISMLEYEFTKSETHKIEADDSTVVAIGRLLRLSTLITVSLIILQNFGFSISGVLAFGGIGGIAVGFAARDLLANFFGALMIFVDKPFSVGDWIRSPDREIEGKVEYIGWRMTRIRTFNQRPLYVPNSTFVNISVENTTRMLNRRFSENIGLRYNDIDKIKPIVEDIKTMLEAHKEIDTNRSYAVALDSYGEYQVNVNVTAFTKTIVGSEFRQIKQDILLKVKDIIQKHGADFAFPTQQLYVNND